MKTIRLFLKGLQVAVIIYLTVAVLLAVYFTFAGRPHHEALQGDEELRARFLECSADEGDAGCDSCYFVIYGYHINPYTGERLNY